MPQRIPARPVGGRLFSAAARPRLLALAALSVPRAWALGGRRGARKGCSDRPSPPPPGSGSGARGGCPPTVEKAGVPQSKCTDTDAQTSRQAHGSPPPATPSRRVPLIPRSTLSPRYVDAKSLSWVAKPTTA
eukprot:364568-Chlamydomonas_euryale.AAC.12